MKQQKKIRRKKKRKPKSAIAYKYKIVPAYAFGQPIAPSLFTISLSSYGYLALVRADAAAAISGQMGARHKT